MSSQRFGLLGAGRQAAKYVLPLCQTGRVTALYHPTGKGFDGRLAPIAPGGTAVEIPHAERLQTFRDLEEFASSPDFDVAVITSPTEHHVEQALLLAQAGKFVLVEKPLGTSPTEVARLTAWSSRIIPILPVPYFAAYQTLTSCISSGELGVVQGASFWRRCPKPNWSLHFSAPESGGALWDLGIHDLHFASLLFDCSEVESADIEYDPNGKLPLRYEAVLKGTTLPGSNCPTLRISSSWMLPHGFEQGFVVTGSAATLRFEGGQLSLVRFGAAAESYPVLQLSLHGFPALLADALTAFTGSGERPARLSLPVAIKAHQLAGMIQAAAGKRTG